MVFSSDFKVIDATSQNPVWLVMTKMLSVLTVHLFFHLVFICAQLQMQKDIHTVSSLDGKEKLL